MIAVGQKLPNATLYEFFDEERDGCSLGPNSFEVEKLTAGKKIVVFALPGAFTPTCSAKHVPGFVEHFDAIKGKGVDEIWCISVNDGFVMAAWGREEKALGKVRFLGDGSAELAKKLGLELDLTAHGMGLRMQRFSLFVDDGIVKQLNVEAPGKFEASTAETMLTQV